MSGPAGGLVEPRARTGRVAARAWDEPVVVTGFAGAVEGELETPAGLAGALVRGPFEDVRLAGAPAAPAARALAAALGHALAEAAAGALPPPEGRAIVVGTRAAALSETIRFMAAVEASGPSLVNPGLFPLTVMNAAAGLAAIHHGCAGANITLNNGLASALDAVVYAADLVASGRAAIAFAGGFEGLGVEASQALDRRRPPLQVAVVLALTTLRSARAAGARAGVRLLAAGSGDLPGLAPAAARREIAAAAVAAAAPLFAPGGTPRDPAGTPAEPEELLLALLGTLVRLRAGGSTEAAALVAGEPGHPSGTALVLAGLDGAGTPAGARGGGS